MLKWSDQLLEDKHDYIQWMFPNRVASQFNCNAPLLTDADIKEFYTNTNMRVRLGRAAARMWSFYDLENDHPWWTTPHNHNFLRLTRILKCLQATGLTQTARRWSLRLEKIGLSNHDVPPSTLQFWRDAMKP